MRLLIGSMVALVMMVSVGCSAVKSPTAVVRSAELGQVTADGLTMNLGLVVSNPNPVSIPLGKTSYALSFGGAKVLDGSASPGVSIPAGGEAPVMLPVSIKWDDLLKAQDAISGAIRSGGDVPFSLAGKVGIGGGIPLIGDRSVPLNYNGVLPLGQALKDPEAILRSPAARALARKLVGALLKS